MTIAARPAVAIGGAVAGFLAVALCLVSALPSTAAGAHPNLVITRQDVDAIRGAIGHPSMLEESYTALKRQADAALAAPIEVPIPKDPAGGATHERHERNSRDIYAAGIVYAITQDARYARFVRDVLDRYAVLYPTLPLHPEAKGEAPGHLFWQTLNDTVWLFYTIQAYDCAYDGLTADERRRYETRIFRPMCDYFIKEVKGQFDLIHNHGTWMDASVGMTGYAIHDADYVDQALLGTRKDGSAGFLRQIDELISPDGFYREGPYYARYAMMPFYLFAEVIQNNDPGRGIFERRDRIFKKLLDATLQQTSRTGAFLPIDDSLKEKSFVSEEIRDAVDIAYRQYGRDPGLLSIAQREDGVLFNGAGLAVSQALASNPHPAPFVWRSVSYADGPEGTWGGISLLRAGPDTDQESVIFKYTSHGLSHGHYDKLGILFYDQDREILQDYGSARFLNVLQKSGGRYLPENETYAKQTVAHNTVVVDERSDFDGKIATAEKHHPRTWYVSAADPGFQVASALDDSAYPGVTLHRTLAIVREKPDSKPLVIDVFRARSSEEHQYDLPYYYLGQLIDVGFPHISHGDDLKPLGAKHGYQHLWNEAEGQGTGTAVFTWLNDNRFYSISTAADASTRLFLVRIGASDPKFNLRPDPGLILRTRARDHVFASVIEPHGRFDPVTEASVQSESGVAKVEVLGANDSGAVVRIGFRSGRIWTLMVADDSADPKAAHAVPCADRDFKWTGPVFIDK